MSRPLDDEDTWEETWEGLVREPLEIRFSIQPKATRSGPERREQAGRLLAELWELPEGERPGLLREGRFQNPDILDLLLEACHSALPFDVQRAVALATLAVQLGSSLFQKGELEGDEALCRSLCLSGSAFRLVGDVAVADASFERAGHLAVSPAERGFFCRSLALLRWDQGRTEEALALLQQGAQRFAEDHDLAQQAVCRALLGLLHLEPGQITRATPLLIQASLDLAGEAQPWLAAQTWLGLALCHAISERREKARSARQRAWAFYSEVKDEKALLALYWLEGRAAYSLGDVQDAGDLLDGVRRKMLGRRWLPEATLVTLDLGLLWLGTGRERVVDALIEEIATTFAGSPGIDLALGGLAHAAEDATAGRLNPEIWNGMASMLRLAFRLQGIPLQPVPFA